MRRLVVLVVVAALLVPFTGVASAGTGEPVGSGTGTRGFGHFLLADENGPVGWVTVDARIVPGTENAPTPDSVFRFDALRGVAKSPGWPMTTRSVISSIGAYHESGAPYPNVVFLNGFECFYWASPSATECREFTATLQDVGPGVAGDTFTWGQYGEELGEYMPVAGNLAVDLGE